MTTFMAWILRQKHREDSVGRLACDVDGDRDFPRGGVEAQREYLDGFGKDVARAFDRARTEWGLGMETGTSALDNASEDSMDDTEEEKERAWRIWQKMTSAQRRYLQMAMSGESLLAHARTSQMRATIGRLRSMGLTNDIGKPTRLGTQVVTWGPVGLHRDNPMHKALADLVVAADAVYELAKGHGVTGSIIMDRYQSCRLALDVVMKEILGSE